MILRLLLQTLAFLGGMGILLFGAAGTWHWLGAWLFLIETGTLSLAVGLWLARHDPALLRERLKPVVSKEQKPWDRVLMGVICACILAWLPLMGLDAKRFGWSHMPEWFGLLGAAGVAISILFSWLTFKMNTFAAPVVRLQSERGQRVVSSGVYAFVRHPMYAGALFFFIGVPLLLGSWLGFVALPIMVVFFGMRVIREERMLKSELDGYEDYTRQVRWRLVPYVW